MITKAKNVDDFLNKIDKSRKADMSAVRKIILETLNDATETMSYGMPAYEIDGKCVVGFNSQKNYMSIYADPRSVAKNRILLIGLNCGKCCIRFTSLKKLPEKTLVKILKDSVEIC